jgi:CelD/BcsL family acetyltransferase involved in cellulose biosynthesis
MTREFTTRLVTDGQEFASCRERWNELAGARVFHRWEWMFHWWQAFGLASHRQLAIVIVLDEAGRWAGIAPWYRSRSATRGRIIRQLASGEACSDFTSIAIRPGLEEPVTAALAKVIVGRSEHRLFRDVDLFELEGHLIDDPGMTSLHRYLAEERVRILEEEFCGTWRMRLAGTWEEFEAGIGRSFRRKTRKATDRLRSADITTAVANRRESLDSVWPIFVELHQKRRNGLGEAGCFADRRFEDFLRHATISLAEAGCARINMAWYNGSPFATNLEFVAGHDVYMYQTGLEPDLANLEPGHLIFALTIQKSIERGFRHFDFLRGDEPYKARWRATRVPLMRMRIVPDRLKARLRSGLWTAGRNFRDWTREKRIIPERAIDPAADGSPSQAGAP